MEPPTARNRRKAAMDYGRRRRRRREEECHPGSYVLLTPPNLHMRGHHGIVQYVYIQYTIRLAAIIQRKARIHMDINRTEQRTTTSSYLLICSPTLAVGSFYIHTCENKSTIIYLRYMVDDMPQPVSRLS
jgi:hypothetical protein